MAEHMFDAPIGRIVRYGNSCVKCSSPSARKICNLIGREESIAALADGLNEKHKVKVSISLLECFPVFRRSKF